VNRIKSWFFQKLNQISLVSLVLTFVALNVVAHGLSGIVRGLDSSLLSNIALYGTLTGWILASVPMAGWLASLLTFLFAIFGVFLRIGRIGPELLALFQGLFKLGSSILEWLTEGITPNWTPLTLALENLKDSIYVLMTRVGDWLIAWTGGEPFYDPVAAALIWGLELWAAAAWAGWFIHRRKQTLPALVPAAIMLGTTLAFSGSKPTSIIWFLGIMFPMMALVTQEERQSHWLKIGLRFSQTMWHSLAIWGTLLSLGLIITAALTQSLSLKNLLSVSHIVTREEAAHREKIADSLGLEQNPVPESSLREFSYKVRSPGLPRRHLIGSGPELTEREVMVIWITSPTITQPDSDTDLVIPRYYWRSNTYDQYTSRGWTTGHTEVEVYTAGQLIRQSDMEGHLHLMQEVIAINEPSQLVYGAGTLVTTDQDFTVEWRSQEDDFGALYTTPTWRSHVDTLVLDVGADELRESGTNYPDWVEARYLSLPDTVPDRVLALARDLTATAPTPYDRALAIEFYLREFPYSLDLPFPPRSQDVVDYFIFDLQKGYCDYYATSMAVLARAAGLPSRIAVGYASGMYDMDLEAYVITEDQAHSWVEIYFPDYGWVDFEPTAELPTRERKGAYQGIEPSKLKNTLELGDLEQPGMDFKQPEPDRTWHVALLISLAVITAGGISWLLIDGLRLSRLSASGVATEVFRRMRHYGPRLRASTFRGETANELYDSLIRRLSYIAQKTNIGHILTPAVDDVRFLTEKYIQVSYSPHKLNNAIKPDLLTTWRRLGWRLWFTWLMTKLLK
jgi:transglutaminase-like putative cysteine protease